LDEGIGITREYGASTRHLGGNRVRVIMSYCKPTKPYLGPL
jgi:hypothetical protein